MTAKQTFAVCRVCVYERTDFMGKSTASAPFPLISNKSRMVSGGRGTTTALLTVRKNLSDSVGQKESAAGVLVCRSAEGRGNRGNILVDPDACLTRKNRQHEGEQEQDNDGDEDAQSGAKQRQEKTLVVVLLRKVPTRCPFS